MQILPWPYYDNKNHLLIDGPISECIKNLNVKRTDNKEFVSCFVRESKTEEDLSSLAIELKKNETLQELFIRSTLFTKKSLSKILHSLENKPLTEIDLNHSKGFNSFNNQDLIDIADLLEKTKITRFRLQDTDITKDQAKVIFDHLNQQKQSQFTIEFKTYEFVTKKVELSSKGFVETFWHF